MLRGGGLHEDEPQRVAVRIVEIARVHEAEILRVARFGAAGGEAERQNAVDLLARLAAEGETRLRVGARVDDLLVGEYLEL